jgi:hypothetical protein
MAAEAGTADAKRAALTANARQIGFFVIMGDPARRRDVDTAAEHDFSTSQADDSRLNAV